LSEGLGITRFRARRGRAGGTGPEVQTELKGRTSAGERSLGGCTMLVREALAARRWSRGGDAQPG
jgi:hypothetical protein